MSAASSGQLLNNLLLFGRVLRALGLDVNPGRMVDLVQALEYVQIARRSDFYFTARSLLVHQKEDLPLFDHAFNLFWQRPQNGRVLGDLFQPALTRQETPVFTLPELETPNEKKTGDDTVDEDEKEREIIEVTRTFSKQEILRRKDFARLTPAEEAMIKRFMADMVWQLGQRRTRRLQPGRGAQLDLRRSLRRNLRYGGELLEWPSRKQKSKPRPLVIIADISGSMEPYSRLLLQFIYSLAGGLDQQVEAFVFSTRLTRITRQMNGRNLDRVLQEVADAVPDWSGGTRIGDALKAFNFDWGRRVLGRGAVVLLISDGWDRGDPQLLSMEVDRLKRSCHRLIWLNPLLGSVRYEPLTRGMQAALPHIDDFLPVHNLVSLEDLAQHLADLTMGKRPLRQQHHSLSGAAFIGKS